MKDIEQIGKEGKKMDHGSEDREMKDDIGMSNEQKEYFPSDPMFILC